MKKRYVAFGCTGVGLVGGLAAVALLGTGLVVGIGVVVPGMVKQKVETLVATQLDANIDADVTMGDLDVSLFSSFPRLRVRVRDVTVVGHGPFADTTLAEIPELQIKVGLMSALSGQTLTVKSVELVDPRFEVVVLPDGRTNTDIFKGDEQAAPTASTGPTGYHLELDDVTITNLEARYEDRKGRTRASVSDLDLAVRANLSDAVSRVDAKGTIGSMSVRQGKTTWLKDTTWKVDALLDYDLQTGGITFRENRTTVNALPLSLTGSAVPQGRDWDVDVAFSAQEATFASVLSLVPNAFRGTMEGVDTAGTLTVGGTAKGRYAGRGDAWPGFDVTVAVRDARFKYPDLPVAIEKIDVDLVARHAQGPSDTTTIDVGRFAFAVAGSEPFVASAKIRHPLTDPVIDAQARGHLDLAALRGAIPMPEGTDPPTGQLDVDVAFSGSKSDFLAPNIERITASGTVRGRNVTYRSEDLPVAVVVDAVEVSLASDSARLESFTAHYASGGGTSDLSATGRLDNLVGYALGGELLTGKLAVSSRELDLRPFQGSGASSGSGPEKERPGKKGKGKPAPAPTTPGEGLLVAVPGDLALTVDADLQHVRTKQVDLEKVRGALVVRDGAVRMNDLQVVMLGGSALVSGAYVAPTAESADVDLTLSAVKFDLGRTFAAVTTLKRMIPVLEGAAGSFDLGMTAKTRLGKDGTPDLSRLASSGLVKPAGVAVRPKSLATAARQLGSAEYSTIDLGGTELAYTIADGVARLQPFSVKLGGLKSSVRGTAGLVNETLDVVFGLKVPTSGLDGTVLAGLKDTFGEKADVSVRVKGPWSDPKITVGLEGVDAGELLGDLVDDLVGGGGKSDGAPEPRKGPAHPDGKTAIAPDTEQAKTGKAGKAVTR